MSRPVDPDLDDYPKVHLMSLASLKRGFTHAARSAAEEKTENRRLRARIKDLEKKGEQHPRLLHALEQLVNYMRHFEIEDPEWPIESLREAEEIIEQVHAP